MFIFNLNKNIESKTKSKGRTKTIKGKHTISLIKKKKFNRSTGVFFLTRCQLFYLISTVSSSVFNSHRTMFSIIKIHILINSKRLKLYIYEILLS